jgi:hypothetical protein
MASPNYHLIICGIEPAAQKAAIQCLLRQYALLRVGASRDAIEAVWEGKDYAVSGSDVKVIMELKSKLEEGGCICRVGEER